VPEPTSTRVPCECCKRNRCNKTLRIPVTSVVAGKTTIVKVCGRCASHDARKLHEWIQTLQKKMDAGQA
jgi:hypothetical protein